MYSFDHKPASPVSSPFHRVHVHVETVSESHARTSPASSLVVVCVSFSLEMLQGLQRSRVSTSHLLIPSVQQLLQLFSSSCRCVALGPTRPSEQYPTAHLLLSRWDRFHTRPLPKRFKVVETLEDCKYTCSGPSECTFVVFNRATGQCWEKYSW